MKIKHYLLSVLTLLTVSMSLAGATVSANVLDPACSAGGGTSVVCTDKAKGNPLYGPNGVLVKGASIITYFVGIAAVIMLVVNGIKYITSNGDSGKVTQARDGIIYALVGLVVALIGRSIIVLVVSRL